MPSFAFRRRAVVRAGALVLGAGVVVPVVAAAPPPRAVVRPARQPDSAAATIDRAARAFQKARTVRAAFEQTLMNPATGNTSQATGELVLQQPNRVSVRFSKPAGDLVVSDGKTLWVYLPSAAPGQVIKLPAKSKGITGVDALGELLTSPRSKYDVAAAGTATVSGRATHAVALTPKADDAPFERAKVWVDDADGSVRQIELTDANGLVRTLRMTSWTLNASVPASTFSFAVPAGARVVDRAALMGGR